MYAIALMLRQLKQLKLFRIQVIVQNENMKAKPHCLTQMEAIVSLRLVFLQVKIRK